MRSLSFVLLPQRRDLNAAAIVQAHERLFPRASRPLVSSSEREGAELRDHDGASTILALMPAAIPNGEAEGAARFSLASFSRKFPPMGAHAAHLIVTTSAATPGLAPLDVLVRHTRIVAASAAACDAIGVYEGNARATHPTAFYLDVASSVERPLMLWTGVSIAQEPSGRTSILTTGVESNLGMPDLLIGAPPGQGNAALGFAFDMLGYVLSRGTPLPDGDTVGRSEAEKLVVRYVPSPVDPSRQVAKIDLQ